MGGGGIEPQALHAVARSCCAPEVALQTPLRNSETVILKLMARLQSCRYWPACARSPVG